MTSRVEKDFGDFMPHTVTHYPLVSTDSYGKRTWASTGTPYASRVSYRPRSVRTSDGQTVTAAGMVTLGDAVNVGINDKIVLPDGSSPQILSVDKNCADELGSYFTRVYFG